MAGLTITVADDASFNLAVIATVRESVNGDTASTNVALNVAVENVAPTLALSTSTPVAAEGGPFALDLFRSDPGDDTISHWEINWGDGSVQVVAGDPASVAHAYADNGVYTVTAKATDEDGVYDAGNSVTATITNVAPTLAAVPDQTIGEGALLNLIDLGKITDPGFANSENPHGASVETFSFSIAWGDGTASDVGAATIDASGPSGTTGSFDGAHLRGQWRVHGHREHRRR